MLGGRRSSILKIVLVQMTNCDVSRVERVSIDQIASSGHFPALTGAISYALQIPTGFLYTTTVLGRRGMSVDNLLALGELLPLDEIRKMALRFLGMSVRLSSVDPRASGLGVS